jgi:hypothetical protein
MGSPADASRQVRTDPHALHEAQSQMNAIARRVIPTQAVDVVKEDPAENQILECAAEAKSDYIMRATVICCVSASSGILRL